MSYVVTAKWIAQEGNENAVEAAIQKLIEPSRAEPGCLVYQPHRSLSDKRVFLLYEAYVDELAYRAHFESEHFKRYALGEGIPLLEAREREFYAPIEINEQAEEHPDLEPKERSR